MTDKPTRLQFDLQPEALEQLEKLKELGGFKDNATAIRNGLRFLGWYLLAKKAGKKIFAATNVNEIVDLEF